jgi:flagellin-specific chaperone FliS
MLNAKWASIMRAEGERWNNVRLTKDDVTTFDWLQNLEFHCAEEHRLKCELKQKEEELAKAKQLVDQLRTNLAHHRFNNGTTAHLQRNTKAEATSFAFSDGLQTGMASELLGSHLYCAGDYAVNKSATHVSPVPYATRLYFSEATATAANNTSQGNGRITYCKGTQTDIGLASASFKASSTETELGKLIQTTSESEVSDGEATGQGRYLCLVRGHHHLQEQTCDTRDLLTEIEKLTEKAKLCQYDMEQTQSACRTHMIQHEAKTKDKEQELHRCRRIVGDLRRALNTQGGELKQHQTAADMVTSACTKEEG